MSCLCSRKYDEKEKRTRILSSGEEVSRNLLIPQQKKLEVKEWHLHFYPFFNPFSFYVYLLCLLSPFLSSCQYDSLLSYFSLQIFPFSVSLLTSSAEFWEITDFLLLFFSSLLPLYLYTEIEEVNDSLLLFLVGINSDTASCSFTATDPCYSERDSQWSL